MPRRRLYFSHSEDVRNDAICRAMSRQRFEEILSSLHLANNNKLDSGNNYAKVRPLLDALGENLSNIFQFSNTFVLMKSWSRIMVGTQGKCSSRGSQFDLATKFGVAAPGRVT